MPLSFDETIAEGCFQRSMLSVYVLHVSETVIQRPRPALKRERADGAEATKGWGSKWL